MARDVLLLTGATGLVGGDLCQQFLSTRPELQVVILARHPNKAAAQFRHNRMSILPGDLRQPNLGLAPAQAHRLHAELTEIVHCAADTRFGVSLEEARGTNQHGTEQLLALARQCPRLRKFAHLSTIYVAGRSTGWLPEAPCSGDKGFINTYQQSKQEAEQLVLQGMNEIPAAIFRLGTILGDSATGTVRQFNYVHQLLKLLPHAHHLDVMPCDPLAPVDLVPTDWAMAALRYLFEFRFIPGQIYQVCAGPEESLTAAQLIELTLEIFARHPVCRKWQPIRLPPQVDLTTYEEYVERAQRKGDILLNELLRVLSYFVPHLALFQAFDNRRALANLNSSGLVLPSIRDCYERVVHYCLDTNWGRNIKGAGSALAKKHDGTAVTIGSPSSWA